MSIEHASHQTKSPEGGKKAEMGSDILLGPGLGGAIKMLRELTTREGVTKFLNKGTELLTGFFGGPFGGEGGHAPAPAAAHG